MFSRFKLLVRGPAAFALVVTLLAAVVYSYANRPMTPERFKALNSRTKVEVIYRQHFFFDTRLNNLMPALEILGTGMEDDNPHVRQAAANTTNELLSFLRMRADRNKPFHIEPEQGQELERIIFEGLQNPQDDSYESFLQITWSLITPGSAFEKLLLEQMQSAPSIDTKAQIWTALMVGWSEDSSFIDSVQQTLEDPFASQKLRNMAIFVAEETASPQLLDSLLSLIASEDEDPYLRLRAMRALRNHGSSDIVLPLLAEQQDSQQWTDEEKAEISGYIVALESNPTGAENLYSMRSYYRKKDGPPLW